MAKTKISEFDTNPALNTDIDSINIAEGCAPSGINNAIRELMSQLKNQQDGSSLDTFTVGNTLTINAANSLRLADTDSSNYVGLKAPGTVSTNYTLTLPAADGTSGQVLSTNGAGTLSFATPGSGALTLLSTVTASAAATVDIETTFNGTYDSYLLIANSCSVSVNTADFRFLMKLGGTYVTTGYIYHVMNSASGSTAYVGQQAVNDAYVPVGASMSNNSNSSLSFAMRIYNPTSTTHKKLITFEGTSLATSGTVIKNSFGSGTNNEISALTGIRFFPPSGTISGTFRLYGIANS